MAKMRIAKQRKFLQFQVMWKWKEEGGPVEGTVYLDRTSIFVIAECADEPYRGKEYCVINSHFGGIIVRGFAEDVLKKVMLTETTEMESDCDEWE